MRSGIDQPQTPTHTPCPVIRVPEPAGILEPLVSAKYRGEGVLGDGSVIYIVEFYVLVAGSDYEEMGLTAPAIRGHVWARRRHIKDFERAAKAAIDLAWQGLQTIGCVRYWDIAEDDNEWMFDHADDLNRAVISEFFMGAPFDFDRVLNSAIRGVSG